MLSARLLHLVSLLVKTASICFVFEITLSHQTKTPFIWLHFLFFVFFNQRWQKKEKQNHTLSFLNSAQNITLSNLPLANDNHKDEQNHQTEYKATLFFSVWSMWWSSQHWSTHKAAPKPCSSNHLPQPRPSGSQEFQSLVKFSSRIPRVPIQFPF